MDFDPLSSAGMLQALTPEQLRLSFTPFKQQDELLQQQMAQAAALRKGSGIQHSTGLGAALGGLADALNNGLGAYQQHQLQGQRQKLFGDMQNEATGRVNATLAALRAYRPPQSTAAPAPSVPTEPDTRGFIPFYF